MRNFIARFFDSFFFQFGAFLIALDWLVWKLTFHIGQWCLKAGMWVSRKQIKKKGETVKIYKVESLGNGICVKAETPTGAIGVAIPELEKISGESSNWHSVEVICENADAIPTAKESKEDYLE